MKENYVRMTRKQFSNLYANHAFTKVEDDYGVANEEAFLVRYRGAEHDTVIIVIDAPHSVD